MHQIKIVSMGLAVGAGFLLLLDNVTKIVVPHRVYDVFEYCGLAILCVSLGLLVIVMADEEREAILRLEAKAYLFLAWCVCRVRGVPAVRLGTFDHPHVEQVWSIISQYCPIVTTDYHRTVFVFSLYGGNLPRKSRLGTVFGRELILNFPSLKLHDPSGTVSEQIEIANAALAVIVAEHGANANAV